MAASSGPIAPIEAGAPDETITPAMIKAGVIELAHFKRGEDSLEETVVEIYLAMTQNR